MPAYRHFENKQMDDDSNKYENYYKLIEALEEQFREVTLAYTDIKNQKLNNVKSYLGVGCAAGQTTEQCLGQENY